MQTVLSVINFLIGNWQSLFASFVTVLICLVAFFHALIAIFLIIPGAEPEKTLQVLADKFQTYIDFLSRFSVKSKTT